MKVRQIEVFEARLRIVEAVAAQPDPIALYRKFLYEVMEDVELREDSEITDDYGSDWGIDSYE